MSSKYSISHNQHVAIISDKEDFLFKKIKESLNNENIINLISFEGISKILSESVDFVISIVSKPGQHTQEIIFDIGRILKPKGISVIYEPLLNRTFDMSDKLKTNLIFAGFINSKIGNLDDFIEVISDKPSWNVGISQTIKLKNKIQTNNNNKPNTNNNNNDDNNDDLIDENTLIDENDLLKPKKIDDCDIPGGKKKACKNCSCGRSDNETSIVPKKRLTLEMLENPGVDSSCGSCSLGDGFRCNGCPYKGLPAFKTGEKIILPADFMIDDL